MNWIDASLMLPKRCEEVFVWIDGHRGPAWRNSYPLVAYLSSAGKWLQERHPNADPLVGVVAWAEIVGPDDEEG